MTPREPIVGPSAWRGSEIKASTRWKCDLSPAQLDDIDELPRIAAARQISWRNAGLAFFPLPSWRPLLAPMASELEDGSGIVQLRGLPVARFAENELRLIWFVIGGHLGRPVYQNRRGELMRDIRDEGAAAGARYGQIAPGDAGRTAFLSSYAPTLTSVQLRFHTDRCDVVGLLCARQAKSGGITRLCSSVAVHNEMLRRRPDLLELLCHDFPRSRFGEESGTPAPVYHLPIFGIRDGKLTSHYSRTFIETAEKVAGVPPLTAAQREALDMLTALADELSFDMVLEPGDMQFLNKHLIYHARTAFTDEAESGHDRLRYRLWLSMPNSRALPVDHGVLWGNTDAGAPRGGIGQVREVGDD